jgi:CheY-like chemotaxis protein
MSDFMVLLVESNPSNVGQFRECLDKMHWVADVPSALQFLHREDAPRPDAIVMTWNSSSADVRNFKKALDGDPKVRKIPVITLAGQIDEDVSTVRPRLGPDPAAQTFDDSARDR